MKEQIKVTVQFLKENRQKLVEKINELHNEKTCIDTTINSLYKTNNICPDCDGSGTIYDKKEAAKYESSDPHFRSSDYKVECERCHGTGKYLEE